MMSIRNDETLAFCQQCGESLTADDITRTQQARLCPDCNRKRLLEAVDLTWVPRRFLSQPEGGLNENFTH